MSLPPCHSRRDLPDEPGVYYCAHPQVHAADQRVTAEVCRACGYWRQPPPAAFRPFPPVPSRTAQGPCFFLGEQTGLRDCPSCRGTVRLKVFACDHPRHRETTLAECKLCPDFEPRLGKRGVSSWAVGVTTAPRHRPTLARCMASLAAAGWERPRLFAEPGAEVPPEFAHLPLTRRDEVLGAWPNWFLALAELVQRQPHAGAYLLVQDDTVFCRNVRALMEQTLWPGERVGLVSCYCPAGYGGPVPGWQLVQAGWDLAGALTYAFPNTAARLLLADPAALSHRRLGPGAGRAYIDSVVGRWAAQARLPVYYHAPSLAQHVGDTSTVWEGARNQGQRCSVTFLGEDFDARSLLPTNQG